MDLRAPSQSTQRVYRDRGAPVERRFEGLPRAVAEASTGLARVPVAELMSRDLTCAHPALAAEVICELLVRDRVGCVPVVDKLGHPIGIVTKRDLVEQLLVLGPVAFDDPATGALLPRTAMELMIPVPVTLAEDATVGQAASVMMREGVHHLAVVDAEGRLIGVISTIDIVRGLAAPADRTTQPR